MLAGLAFLSLYFGVGRFENLCPAFISCHSSLKQESCPRGTFYRQNVRVGGCCPGCVPLKGESHACEIPTDCEPGLTCTAEKICSKDPQQACEYYKRFASTFGGKGYWDPICSSDGTYATKQCKGEKLSGKCFCSDKMGNRIFGEENWFGADNMTCVCSRLMDEMKRGKTKSTLHCDDLGNFELLQCDQKVCWCASPKTGIPYSSVVPIEDITFLPCYDRHRQGNQYYRKCESKIRSHEDAKALLMNHGTITVTSVIPKCNFDGSYHRVQMSKDKTRCVYVNGFPLTEEVSASDANCNCAYDRHIHQLHQKPFLFECQPNGNYVNRQTWEGKIYCVDPDGFTYSSDEDDCPSTLHDP